MKKVLSLSLVLFALAVSVMAQDRKTLEGNGKVVTREVAVQPFDVLDAGGVCEIVLMQGAKEAVKVETDENLQDLFVIRNEGNKLVVEMKELKNTNLKSTSKMRVYVTFKDLKKLHLHTVGTVRSEGMLTFGELDLHNSSVGDINLNMTATKLNLQNKSVGGLTLTGKAQNAVMVNKSVGDLDAGNFVVQSIDIDNSGIGTAKVNAEKDLKVKDNFLGKVKNKGAAPARNNNKVRI